MSMKITFHFSCHQDSVWPVPMLCGKLNILQKVLCSMLNAYYYMRHGVSFSCVI